MSARTFLLYVVPAIVVAASVACANRAASTEISREHAIEIARMEISFEPDRVDAVRTVSGTTPVWRVTFVGRLPGQPPGLFETVTVEVDRRTGDIVSVARP